MPTPRPDPDWLRLIQEMLRRNQELFSSQNIAKQLQEAMRRNQELFSSQNVAKQLQESLRRNQELLSSPDFQQRISDALRANRAALRDSLTDLEGAAVEPEAAGLPGEAASWVRWLVALPPLSKLLVLNMLFGLLVALLNQAAAYGADVPPALTASIGSVVAVISVVLGVRELRDDESD